MWSVLGQFLPSSRIDDIDWPDGGQGREVSEKARTEMNLKGKSKEADAIDLIVSPNFQLSEATRGDV